MAQKGAELWHKKRRRVIAQKKGAELQHKNSRVMSQK